MDVTGDGTRVDWNLFTSQVLAGNAPGDPLTRRLPVILPPEAFELWLDCRNVDALTAAAMLVPTRPGRLEAYEISPAVNHAGNDGPQLIEPVAAQPIAAAPAARPSKREPRKDERQGSLF